MCSSDLHLAAGAKVAKKVAHPKKGPATKVRVASKRALPIKATTKKAGKKSSPARAKKPVARSKSGKKR